MWLSRHSAGFTPKIRTMKTKILSLVLISVGLMSCGAVTIEFGQDADLKGTVKLPGGITSQSVLDVQQMALPSDARAVSGEYVVKLSSAEARSSIRQQGVLIRPMRHADGTDQWGVVKAASLQAARQLPGVVYAQPNYIYTALRVPNDPLAQPTAAGDSTKQWYLGPIGAYKAWERVAEFDNQVKVAVIDDGYRAHDDMPSNFFDLGNAGCNTSTGQNCLDVVDYDNDPKYEPINAGEASHGMAVAGVIGAMTDNGLGMAGLGYNKITVVPIKITTTDKDNDVTTSEGISNAFNTAITKKSKVINFSFCLTGADPQVDPCAYGIDPAVEATLLAAQTQNITVVVAAGNSGKGQVAYPASSPNVISVGATDKDNRRAFFSNYGSGLDLVAPGQEIRTLNITNPGPTNEYGVENGTSFSAPIVAGAAALLYSRHPSLTDERVRQLLIEQGDVPADSSINNARFLRIDKALAADPFKYVGKVTLQRNGQEVKETAWIDFAAKAGSFSYELKDVPTGTYTFIAEVAQKGDLTDILYSCSASLTLSSTTTVSADVSTPLNNESCF